MPNPVTLAHVAARFPAALTAQQQLNATAWLGDIWQMLLERRPTIEDDITDETVKTDTVIRVLAEAVVRKLLNPERKLEESIDDYRFKREEGTGMLYLDSSELNDLTPPVTTGGTHNSVRLVAYGES